MSYMRFEFSTIIDICHLDLNLMPFNRTRFANGWGFLSKIYARFKGANVREVTTLGLPTLRLELSKANNQLRVHVF